MLCKVEWVPLCVEGGALEGSVRADLASEKPSVVKVKAAWSGWDELWWLPPSAEPGKLVSRSLCGWWPPALCKPGLQTPSPAGPGSLGGWLGDGGRGSCPSTLLSAGQCRLWECGPPGQVLQAAREPELCCEASGGVFALQRQPQSTRPAAQLWGRRRLVSWGGRERLAGVILQVDLSPVAGWTLVCVTRAPGDVPCSVARGSPLCCSLAPTRAPVAVAVPAHTSRCP